MKCECNKPRLIRLTFLDKKETELIGHNITWTEEKRWISAEDVRLIMISPQYKKTAMTWGGQAFLVKETVDEVAALVNGDKDVVYDDDGKV